MIREIPFYDTYYARRLVTQVRLLGRLHRDLQVPAFPRRPTIWDFDSLYTAPLGGFRDVPDYQARASALPFVPMIRLPAYLLAARDDPFVAWQSYAELPRLDNVTVRLEDRGGHLGFLGSDGRGGIRWAETQVIDWIRRLL
jgi:predicted alpha/beta-fold hydrolase